jgi:hypothetical protein
MKRGRQSLNRTEAEKVAQYFATCRDCGKEHDLRDLPGGYSTWADPDDNHVYRARDNGVAQTIRKAMNERADAMRARLR